MSSTSGGLGFAVFFLVMGLLYLLVFAGLVALGTLVARRVWRWDARREQQRQADVAPGEP